MSVAILKQGEHLIASIQSALLDHEVLELRDELADRVGRLRAVQLTASANESRSIRNFTDASLPEFGAKWARSVWCILP